MLALLKALRTAELSSRCSSHQNSQAFRKQALGWLVTSPNVSGQSLLPRRPLSQDSPVYYAWSEYPDQKITSHLSVFHSDLCGLVQVPLVLRLSPPWDSPQLSARSTHSTLFIGPVCPGPPSHLSLHHKALYRLEINLPLSSQTIRDAFPIESSRAALVPAEERQYQLEISLRSHLCFDSIHS
ncbi:hypothetical protein FVER53590_29985 [Fusarium verticillioides]|nr:hypothetical protein FVER53590_29985 [Fusarium verticillioides]